MVVLKGCKSIRTSQKQEIPHKNTTIAMQSPDLQPDQSIDIVSETCPMTFVLVRLALDQMRLGQVLEIHLRGDEPRRNIPLTAREQGHEVLGMTDLPDGHSVLWLRRGPA